MTDNPRQQQIERALAGFYERADAGRVPKRRRYHRVVGAPAGTHQHARRKRNQQRRNAYNWRVRP
jgi:hypothetical protein